MISAGLQVGDIFRKLGPCDWCRVEAIILPGRRDFDGGAPGVSVVFSEFYRGKPRWSKKVWFVLARDEAHFLKQMEDSWRFPAPQGTPLGWMEIPGPIETPSWPVAELEVQL